MMGELWVHIKNKIDKNQFGAMKGKSTTMAVIKLLDELYRGADTNMISRVLFIDFAKAFDRIDHSILIRKLLNLVSQVGYASGSQGFLYLGAKG